MFLTPFAHHKEAGKVQLTKAAVQLTDLLNHIACK
jgi:hypothetical protein